MEEDAQLQILLHTEREKKKQDLGMTPNNI